MGCGMIIDDTLYASILLLLQCFLIGYLVRFSFADIALPWAIDNVAYLRWLSIIIHAHNPPGNEKGTIISLRRQGTIEWGSERTGLLSRRHKIMSRLGGEKMSGPACRGVSKVETSHWNGDRDT